MFWTRPTLITFLFATVAISAPIPSESNKIGGSLFRDKFESAASDGGTLDGALGGAAAGFGLGGGLTPTGLGGAAVGALLGSAVGKPIKGAIAVAPDVFEAVKTEGIQGAIKEFEEGVKEPSHITGQE